jgi:hypothetical protein
MRYDASEAPDPEQWLELDESDRLDLVTITYAQNYLSARTRGCTRQLMSSSKIRSPWAMRRWCRQHSPV